MAKSKAVSIAITADSTSLRSEVERVKKTLDTLGASAKKAAKDLGVLKTIEIGKIAFAGISAGVGAITSLGTSALEMASRVSTAVDSLNDLSNRTGIALKPLQGFALAAKLAGVDAEGFAIAVTRMSVNIGKSTPGDAFAKSLADIGVSVSDLQGMKPEQQFSAIGKAIQNIPTAAGRAAASVEVFGRAGATLSPLFQKGAASLADLTARAERLGIILQDDQIANVAAMNDGFDLVSATVDGIIGQILGDLSPVVTKMLDDMLKFVEAFQGAGGATGGTAIAQAITDGILIGVKFFLQGIQSLEKVFFDFLVGIDNLPGISVDLSPAQKELVNARAQNNTEGVRQARNRGNDSQGLVAAADKRLAAAEAALANTGVQVAIDFVDSFTKSLEESRKAASAVAAMVGALPVGIGDTADAKASRKADAAAAVKAAADTAKAAAKASEDAASRVAGLQPNDEKARVTFLKDIAAVNVTIAAAETAAAAARKAGDADGLKAAEERLALVYEQAGVAVQIATQNRKDKELAALKAGTDLKKQADEIMAAVKIDLVAPSRKALQANDVRTSAGASQLASFSRGEHDPAIEQARLQTAKLEEIRKQQADLAARQVDIL